MASHSSGLVGWGTTWPGMTREALEMIGLAELATIPSSIRGDDCHCGATSSYMGERSVRAPNSLLDV